MGTTKCMLKDKMKIKYTEIMVMIFPYYELSLKLHTVHTYIYNLTKHIFNNDNYHIPYS